MAWRYVVRDVLIVALTFTSGAVDAISFVAFGQVFTAIMTGNLVLLGIALGHGLSADSLHAVTALVGFVIGLMLGRLATGATRTSELWPVRVSLALAIDAVAQATVVTAWLVTHGRPGTFGVLPLIGLFATAMGAQSAAARRLAISGISTTFVTGTLTSLVSDLISRSGTWRSRIHQAAALAALLAGAAGGASLVFTARLAAPALPLAVVVLTLLTAIVTLHHRAEG